MQRRWLMIFTVLVAWSGFLAEASADYRDHDYRTVRLYGGLGLGFGGKAHIDATGPLGVLEGHSSDDLITSVGGQVGVDVPVWRFLSLGAEARLLSFNTQTLDDHNVDRSKLLDIDFKPKLRLPLGKSPVELYFTVPVGLTVPFLANNFGDNGSTDSKVGWNVGVGGGVNFWLTDAFALNFEPMFLVHKFSVDGPGASHADVRLRQFTMFINLMVAL